MRIFSKILLSILLVPAFASAQSNYKPGYVVTAKGDTLQGYINYKEWNQNPSGIAFKKNVSDQQPLKFSTNNASAFAINGFEYYQRHIVSVSQDFTYFDKLSTTIDTTTKVDTVFLRILTKGSIVALYSYTDAIKERYYESDAGDNEPKELIHHIYLQADSNAYGALSKKYINRYRMQLRYIAEKNHLNYYSLETRISESSYDENDLFKIAALINGSSTKQFVSRSQLGIRWFAGAAANFSSFKFNGDFLLAKAPAGNNITPRLSAGIDMFPNKNVQKLYFRLELSFWYGHYHYAHSDPDLVPSGTSATLSLSQYNATLVPQIVYNIYNKEQLKFFVSVGAAINQSFYNDYKVITTYDAFPANVQDRYPEMQKFWVGFPIKSGLAVGKKLELYISYMPTTTVSTGNDVRDVNFSARTTSYAVGLNYFFGAK